MSISVPHPSEGPDLDERIERWLFSVYPPNVAIEMKSSIKRGLLTAVWDDELKMADIKPAGPQEASA